MAKKVTAKKKPARVKEKEIEKEIEEEQEPAPAQAADQIGVGDVAEGAVLAIGRDAHAYGKIEIHLPDSLELSGSRLPQRNPLFVGREETFAHLLLAMKLFVLFTEHLIIGLQILPVVEKQQSAL